MDKAEKVKQIHIKQKGFERQESSFEKFKEGVIVDTRHWNDKSCITLKRTNHGSTNFLYFDREVYSTKEVNEMAEQFDQGLKFLVGQLEQKFNQRKENFTESFEIQTTDD